jgi:hypothetical protein
MRLSIRKDPKDPDVFEITVATALLRTQFLLPREMMNKLRIMIEDALVGKKTSAP